MSTNYNMSTICRLCLSSGYQNWHFLDENTEVINKIHACLTVQLSANKLLPSQICQECFDKIEEIHQFHLNIIKNEKTLTNYLFNKENNLLNTHTVFIDTEPMKIIKEEPTELESEHNFSSDEDTPLTLIKETKKQTTINKKTNKQNTINIEKKFKQKTIETNEKQFKCLMCFQICDSIDLLFSHYNTEHIDKEYLDSTKAEYTMNVNRDGVKVFTCAQCNKDWFSKRCIDRHWILVHVKCRPFICKLCSRTYKTAADLVRHARVHKEECKMLCSFNCGYSTVYKGAMTDHEKRHKNDFKYTCNDCGRGFNVQTSYTQHLNIHKGLKPFVCDLCGIAFTMDKYLYQHKIKVHEVSASTKRYICVHCSLPFDGKHLLNQHLKEHGKIITCHLCDICGKDFPTSSKLRIHKNSHLGLRPFTCSLCPKTFAKKFNLKLHEVTHTGEKNFTCSHCGKHYTQKSALHRHITKHHSGSSSNT